jgi:hypothetical protein
VPDEQRVAVTLFNGRSHILRLPPEVAAEDAGAALTGRRPGSEVGWAEADEEWLAAEQAGVWVRKSAIIEVAVVDYPDDPSVALTYGY